MSGHKEHQSGPPNAGGPDFIVVGKVRRPHGVHGEVVVEIITKFPERLCPLKSIYIGKNHLKMNITSQRSHHEGLLLGFDGITSPEEAGRFRNQILSVASSESPQLSHGEFFFHELLDSKVIDEKGNLLGRLTDILQTGANDVYVITDSAGAELLLPAISDVIRKVDVPNKIIEIRLIPGLKD